MSKARLAEALARRGGFAKRDAERLVEGLFALCREALLRGETLKLSGLGTFEVLRRAARRGRNPQTRAPMQLPADAGMRFMPSARLREALEGERGDEGVDGN